MTVTSRTIYGGENADTIAGIDENIENIIKNILGWKIEDLSDDPTLSSTTLAQIDFREIDFKEDNNFHEKKARAEIRYDIKVQSRQNTPLAARVVAADIIYSLKENLKVDDLNVGELSESKLVTNVEHLGASISRRQTIAKVTYGIKIRFAEIQG